MDAASRSLGKFPSTIASNFWVLPPKPGDVDFRFFATYRLPLRPQCGKVATIPIRNGEVECSNLTALKTLAKVLPLTPVLITRRGFLLTHALPHTVSTTTSFISGVKTVCGATTTGAILWSILEFFFGTTTGRVRLINMFCSKLPFLVSINVSYCC